MYAGICAVSLAAVLGISYLVLQRNLERRLDQGLLNEIAEYASLLETQDLDVLKDVLQQEAVSEGTDQVFFRVLDTAGTDIVGSDMSRWADVAAARGPLAAAAAGESVFETHRHDDRPYPTRIAYGRVGPGLVLQLGESMAGDAEVLQRFRDTLGFATIALVLCSVVGGGFMARRALLGVQQVTQTARDIASGAWHSRVPVSHRNDEIDELAAAFNEMVDRIQTLIKELREVTDDIAHDLRTPVMRMRAAAESALLGTEKDESQEEMAGSILEECDRLLGLINTTLEVSQTEAGATPLARTCFDLSDVAEDVYELFRAAAEDKGVTLAFQPHSALVVDGDPQKLRRAIAHLVDNAVKYTQAGGEVDVICRRKDRAAAVSIEDTGGGIPESDLEKVFARFYRVDQSRGQGGNGLGLTLSRAICRAHGGDVRAASVLGEGSTFEVTLPLAVP